MELPSLLIQRLQEEMPELIPQLLNSFEEAQPVVSFRVNKFKSSSLKLDGLESVPWCEGGFWLPDRPSFTLDPAFHAGAYYVQESASMILDHVVRQLPDYHVAIDVCAAPGGKSTILADHLSPDGVLLANEIVPKRAEILVENINKWGNSRVVVTNAAPEQLSELGSLADLVLVDAPCSGEGMFRKDQEAIARWKSDLPTSCSKLQKDILAAAILMLKAGGHLIYSTCTFGKCENEENWLWLKSQGFIPVELNIPAQWGFVDSHSLFPEIPAGYAFKGIPGFSKGEGFFVCVFRKAGNESHLIDHSPEPDATHNWPIETALSIIRTADRFWAVSSIQSKLLQRIDSFKDIKVLRRGGEIGILNKDANLVPAHALALSTDVKIDYAEYRMPRAQALWYLSRKEFLPQKLPKGFFKVMFESWCLGWGNTNREGKFVNCYPAHLKIKMSIPNQTSIADVL